MHLNETWFIAILQRTNLNRGDGLSTFPRLISVDLLKVRVECIDLCLAHRTYEGIPYDCANKQIRDRVEHGR